MANKPVAIVTRPDPQASLLCDQLAEQGFEPHSLPMLELVALESLDDQAQQYIAELQHFDHIIFISGNAVRLGMNWIASSWPELPPRPNWFAIGDATAAALQEYGVSAINGGPQMTSESLLAHPLLQEVERQRVLIVKGEGGRISLQETLNQRGANVAALCCYQRRSPAMAAGELAGTMARLHPQVILVSSGEALDNMLALLSPQETTKLTLVPLIVPSDRVARIANERGFANVRSAANASDAAMLQLAQEWRQNNFSGTGE